MKYHAVIINRETKEVRLFEDDWTDRPGEDVVERNGDMLYQWTEGNYGCDCNRALFFARAAGEEEEEENPPCGHTLFLVPRLLLPGDEILRVDDDPS